MSKQILLKGASRDKLLEGVNLLADVVQSTLGPSGKTVIIHDDSTENPFTTKDGVTAAEACNHPNPVMNAGIQMIKAVASKMNMDNADGTTTVTVICRELIKLGVEAQKMPDFNHHKFKVAIEKCLEETIEIINKHVTPITLKDIYKIAYTSGNNDEEIGNLFQQAYDNAKADGYINIAESVTGKSFVDVVKGFVIDMGYAERKYANDQIHGIFKAEKCNVLIYDNELTDKKEMNKIVEKFAHMASQLPLLIIAKDYSKDVERIVDYINLDKINLQICLMKNQLRNDEYRNLLMDISNFTGAEICKNYDPIDYVSGIANDLIVKQSHTIFGAPIGTQSKVFGDYIIELKEQAKNESSVAYSEQIKKRISKMTNGVTTMYIGGNSAMEIKERRDRIDDAYGACKAALESNVIVGGSNSLLIIAKQFEKMFDKKSYEYIFAQAIKQPFIQILLNSNHSTEEISMISSKISWNNGYNAKSRDYEDFISSGVVDPVKVVIGGVVNATSIAMSILSTECLIVEVGNNNYTAQ